MKYLAGVGDMAAQWEEVGSRAFHIRRRLTASEQAAYTGPVVDLRGTVEGWERFRAMRDSLIPLAREFAKDELGPEPPENSAGQEGPESVVSAKCQ